MICRLKKREQFLRAASARKWSTDLFLLQAFDRKEETSFPARFGFTVTKKIGKAVIRNRVRRRLREAVSCAMGNRYVEESSVNGWDYVLVARPGAGTAPFDQLVRTVSQALISGQKGKRRSRSPQNRVPSQVHQEKVRQQHGS